MIISIKEVNSDVRLLSEAEGQKEVGEGGQRWCTELKSAIYSNTHSVL